MLLFWICAGLLTVAAVLAISRPLTRSLAGVASSPDGEDRSGAHAVDADVGVYRQQLAEIDSDVTRGLMSEAEAEAARVEIARRLLARTQSLGSQARGDVALAESSFPAAVDTAVPTRSRDGRERLFIVVAGLVPALALGLYLAQGSPGLPAQPAAERLAKAPAANVAIEELIARVEGRLRTNPTDGQGWDVIAPVYLKLERFRDANEAYRRAITLLGESVQRLSGLAESSVLANDGIVSEEARIAYRRVLELDGDRFEARFGLALALEQDGDVESATKAYEAILQASPPRAPWRQFVVERMDALAEKAGKSTPGGKTQLAPSGAEATIAALPEGERRQVIMQMVDSLAQRLKAEGNDLEGWRRLLRSWMVLGEPDKAESALGDARKALGMNPTALGEINSFAKALGLKS